MDVFELNTYAWEDDVADLPLKYIFAYVSGSASESDTASEFIVRAALESSEATDVYLPQVGGTELAFMQCSRGTCFSRHDSRKHCRCKASVWPLG